MDELKQIKDCWHTTIYCGTDELLFRRAVRDIGKLYATIEELKVENEQLRAQVTIAQAENTAIEEFIAEHGTIRRTYGRESR